MMRYIVYVTQVGTGRDKPFLFRHEWAARAFAAETGGRFEDLAA